MIGSVLRITAATAFVILAMLLPFLPGRYDSLAAALSLMARLIGTVGLLVVPIGALWMASEYVNALRRKRYAFAVTALIVSSLVWVLIGSISGSIDRVVTCRVTDYGCLVASFHVVGAVAIST